jgi:hypothetical protein
MKADGEPLVLLPALYRRRLFLTVSGQTSIGVRDISELAVAECFESPAERAFDQGNHFLSGRP